jgi:hypothetical protein
VTSSEQPWKQKVSLKMSRCSTLHLAHAANYFRRAREESDRFLGAAGNEAGRLRAAQGARAPWLGCTYGAAAAGRCLEPQSLNQKEFTFSKLGLAEGGRPSAGVGGVDITVGLEDHLDRGQRGSRCSGTTLPTILKFVF